MNFISFIEWVGWMNGAATAPPTGEDSADSTTITADSTLITADAT